MGSQIFNSASPAVWAVLSPFESLIGDTSLVACWGSGASPAVGLLLINSDRKIEAVTSMTESLGDLRYAGHFRSVQ